MNNNYTINSDVDALNAMSAAKTYSQNQKIQAEHEAVKNVTSRDMDINGSGTSRIEFNNRQVISSNSTKMTANVRAKDEEFVMVDVMKVKRTAADANDWWFDTIDPEITIEGRPPEAHEDVTQDVADNFVTFNTEGTFLSCRCFASTDHR